MPDGIVVNTNIPAPGYRSYDLQRDLWLEFSMSMRSSNAHTVITGLGASAKRASKVMKVTTNAIVSEPRDPEEHLKADGLWERDEEYFFAVGCFQGYRIPLIPGLAEPPEFWADGEDWQLPAGGVAQWLAEERAGGEGRGYDNGYAEPKERVTIRLMDGQELRTYSRHEYESDEQKPEEPEGLGRSWVRL